MGRKRRNGTRKIHQSDQQRKAALISQCLDQDPVNLKLLRSLALKEGGLLNNEIRYRAWPKLLGINIYDAPNYKAFATENKDSDQIQRDIDRSLWHFTCDKQLTDEARNSQRSILSAMINAMVVLHPDLYYYQGYHDVVTVFLRVMGKHRAFQMIEQCSLHHFRECMHSDFERTTPVLRLLFTLIEHEDADVAQFLTQSEVEPFFALPWLITWFAHNFDDIGCVARIYDACLASHPMFSLYFCAAMVLHRRNELLHETECEFSMVHNFLAKLPKEVPIDKLLQQALAIFQKLPPEQLIKQSKEQFPLKSEWMTWNWFDAQNIRSNAHLWTEARGKKPKRKHGSRQKQERRYSKGVCDAHILRWQFPSLANISHLSLFLCLLCFIIFVVCAWSGIS